MEEWFSLLLQQWRKGLFTTPAMEKGSLYYSSNGRKVLFTSPAMEERFSLLSQQLRKVFFTSPQLLI